MEKKKRDANFQFLLFHVHSLVITISKKGGNLFLPHARIGKDVSFGNYLSIIHRQKTWILHHQLITRLSKRFVDRKLLSSIEFRRVKYSEEEGNCGEKIWERKIGGRLKVGGRQTLNFPT